MRVQPLVAAVVLAGTLYVGARPVGPVPALGAFLDPAHGVWSNARSTGAHGDATASVPGLGADVQVVYDQRGVPHIFAARETDAYRALGYVVARDRLFQMYVQMLAGAGRLTELGGARLLDADREARHLGMPWGAERGMRSIDTTGASWSVAKAYADGVNAYVAQMPASALPMEFRLLGVKPPRWDPANALHIQNRMGYTLALIDPETDRAAAAARVGRAAAASLFPERDPIVEPIQPNGSQVPRFDFTRLAPPGVPDTTSDGVATVADAWFPGRAERVARSMRDEAITMASNNSAVAPRRSATGHALLAGDPHLDLSLPSIWYEAHLVVPGVMDTYGVTIPGVPGIVIGFNRDVAWTFTNTSADVIDYYAERVDDDARPTRYFLDGAWRPLEQRVEQYRGPNGAIVATDTIRFTHRGPLQRIRGRWVSMRWTELEPQDAVAWIRAASTARTVREWHDGVSAHFFAPAQNMMVADRQGSIGVRSTGRFPIRPDSFGGMIVRDGTLSSSDWRGWLPVDRYPQSIDPAQGYLASANQQPIDPRMTTDYWGGSYDPWRALRIDALLRTDSQVTLDKMRRFQTDPGSARADYFVPFLLGASRTPRPEVDASRLAEATRLLAQWDRRYTATDTRAVLFEETMRLLAFAAWDELDRPGAAPQRATGAFGERTTAPARAVAVPSVALASLLTDSANAWWDVRATPNRVEHRDDVVAAALVAALDSCVAKFGPPDGGGWTWGKIRHANIWHLLRLPALSALDLPVSGGPSTLAPSSGSGTHGPSWRMVVEMGPEVRAMAIYPGGQSGDPIDPRYKDHLGRWIAGELDTLIVPHAAAELSGARRASTLTLTPERR